MTKRAVFAVALLSLALCAGCATGGGGHSRGIQVTVANGNVQAIGVTLTVQFTATVTGTTNTAVTWSVRQSGAACGTCGTISSSGLFTAPSTAPATEEVDIVATSQADTSRSGSLSVNVVQIKVIATPKLSNDPLSIAKGVQQQFTATAVPDDARAQHFTWSLTCDAGGNVCGTIDTDSGVFTAPASVPSPATGRITATSTIDPTGPPGSDSNIIDIAIVQSRLLGNTTYAFRLSGFDANGAIAIAGNFLTNSAGTAIVDGTQDELTTTTHATRIITGGALSLDSNVHGTLTLTTPAGSRIYKVALNAAGDGKMIELDGTGRASGEFAKATKSKFHNDALPAGSKFVFGLTGVDTVLKRAGFAGLFQPDGAGTISSGMLDVNENGSASSSTDVAGDYDLDTTSDGRGTMHLTNNTSGKTYNYAIYMVGGTTNDKNPLTLFVISTDDPQVNPAVSGTIAYQDVSATSFNTFAVSSLTGVDAATGATTMVSLTNSVGDGSGHINGTYDANNAGSIVKAQGFACGYTASGGGRYVVTLLGDGSTCGSSAVPFVFYARANSAGFLLDQSSQAVYTGEMQQQPGGDFAASELAGSFAAATVNAGTTDASQAAMNLLMTSVVPSFTLSGKRDETDNGGSNAAQALTGTYTVKLDGTGTMKITPSGESEQNYVIYVLDNPNSSDNMIQHFVMMNVDPANTSPAIIFGER